MYPDPVIFVRVEPGPGGVLIRWTAPDAEDPASRFLVFRSATPIPAERTEDFYAGALAGLVHVATSADHRAVLDGGPHHAVWYLVQALLQSGDIGQVAFTLEPVGDAPLGLPERLLTVADLGAPPRGPDARGQQRSIYRDPPELIFRNDDQRVRFTTRAMARSLEAAHTGRPPTVGAPPLLSLDEEPE